MYEGNILRCARLPIAFLSFAALLLAIISESFLQQEPKLADI